MSPVSAQRSPRPYAEFRIGFVVAGSEGSDGGPRARLEGIEQTLSRLIRRWRPGDQLSAARDIRIAPSTLDELVTWIEGDEAIDAGVLERLATYQSGAVADPSVPRGWIRVYLGVGWTGPDGLRAGGG